MKERILIGIDEDAALEIYAMANKLVELEIYRSFQNYEMTDLLLVAFLEWWFLCEQYGLEEIVDNCLRSTDPSFSESLVRQLKEMAAPVKRTYPILFEYIELVQDYMERKYRTNNIFIEDPEMNHAAQVMVFWLHTE